MKKIYLMMLMAGIPVSAFSQSAIDAYRVSQPDLKGTARFMSMAGAFGALGGDLSTISQNPGGVGVYRSNELGFTINLDVQSSSSESQGYKWNANQTKFLLNNIGGVATLRLNSETMPNLNLGFTYNKAVSFNRKYNGGIANLGNSMSNYIAGIANNENLTVADVETTNTYDPYNPTDGGIAAPWLAILGYDSYLINPNGDPDNPHWTGQWGNGTSGSGSFAVMESGSVDEYNIAFGGNIKNLLYWGMNFDIINIDYNLNSYWGEDMQGAYVLNPNNGLVGPTESSWSMRNLYRASGSGFNYQLGFILKPIQEFRLGFAFHTPTWYKLTETYSASTSMNYYGRNGSASTNDGYPAYNDVNLRSPWKIIVSAAGVIGNNFIISADYEWAGYNRMKFSEPTGVYNDYGYDYDWGIMPYSNDFYQDAYYETNKDIRDIYRSTNTLRIGAEYRINPSFSIRAGYSYVSSPVNVEARDDHKTIYTAGTLPNYRFDDITNYITCGLGYKHRGFYIDLAYVYKHMNSEYHAYTPDPSSNIQSPQAAVKFNNSQIVMSMGFRF